MKTKTEQIIEHLISCGYKETTGLTKKYRTFFHPTKTFLYFVGKAGALRRGLNSSSSVSVTDQIQWIFKMEGKL